MCASSHTRARELLTVQLYDIDRKLRCLRTWQMDFNGNVQTRMLWLCLCCNSCVATSPPPLAIFFSIEIEKIVVAFKHMCTFAKEIDGTLSSFHTPLQVFPIWPTLNVKVLVCVYASELFGIHESIFKHNGLKVKYIVEMIR